MTQPDTERFSVREGITLRGACLVKDIYKVCCFCRAKRRRAIGRLIGPQSCGDDEGDELRLDSELHKVFRGNGGKV